VADVVVVGAGAAGIIAAWRAASLGASVRLIEKTNRLGTKILISGGGKCNITHDGPLEDVLKAFRPNEARFIRPSCYRFRNHEIVEMLTSRGLRVYTRPDGRIFPVDQTAKDVVAILQSYLDDVRVRLELETSVLAITATNGKIRGIETSAGPIPTDRLVVAVGGASYPSSGTTGDGWPWLEGLGHTIVKPRAALSPIYLDAENLQPEFSGVALRSVMLRARKNGKEVDRWTGDLLFTHKGVSGPNALGISRIVAEHFGGGPVTLDVDLFPNEPPEDLAARLLAFSQANPTRRVVTFFEEVVPERLQAFVLAQAAIEPATVFGKLERKSRNRLADTLRRLELGRVRHVPLEKGEVTAGGVSLDEVDPQTMTSRKVQGLFLCGEVMDIAGPVGGYNLQAAFATGFVAGETAAKA